MLSSFLFIRRGADACQAILARLGDGRGGAGPRAPQDTAPQETESRPGSGTATLEPTFAARIAGGSPARPAGRPRPRPVSRAAAGPESGAASRPGLGTAPAPDSAPDSAPDPASDPASGAAFFLRCGEQADPARILTFDAAEDSLITVYEAGTRAPVISVTDNGDGTHMVAADGVPVARVAAATLSPDDIALYEQGG